MARPTAPLISKRQTAEVALRLIDEFGLDDFNMRQLGNELNVNAASLYHHFANKDAILLSAARLALDGVRAASDSAVPGPDPLEDLIQEFLAYRLALLEHPAIVPLIAQRDAMRFGLREAAHWIGRLRDAGIPENRIIPMTSLLEALVLGSVTIEINRKGERFPEGLEAYSDVTTLVTGATDTNYDEQFELGCRALVAALTEKQFTS